MIRFIAILVALVSTSPAFAWNALGHKVVAEIAWRQLDPAKRQEIVEILRRHPRFDADFAGKMTDDVLAGDKAIQDRWIFQHAATWPDIAKGLSKGERSKYDRSVWHYVNFPLFVDPSDRKSLGKLSVNLSTDYTLNEDKKQFNVIQAIKYSRTAIKSKTGAETKALAYCWLFHLVGDLHQPLHSTALFSAAHFPKGDRGGNSIPLVRGDNLHSLWDNLLGRQYFIRDVDKAIVELSDRTQFGDVWNTAANETNPIKWAKESHDLCESFVYDAAILNEVRTTPEGTELARIELPTSYMRDAGEHARGRIIAGGLRLAKVLSAQPSKQRNEQDVTSPAIQQVPVTQLVPTSQLTPAKSIERASLTHWLNTNSNARHNSSCKWYGKTKHGLYCSAEEGKPCGECGG
jgi:hypothetical protein